MALRRPRLVTVDVSRSVIRGTDVITLLIALSLLLASMLGYRRGSPRRLARLPEPATR